MASNGAVCFSPDGQTPGKCYNGGCMHSVGMWLII